jgi:hypothetical protein
LAEHKERCFANQQTWHAHLDKLGITELKVSPDPVGIATEAALSGRVKAHGGLRCGQGLFYRKRIERIGIIVARRRSRLRRCRQCLW